MNVKRRGERRMRGGRRRRRRGRRQRRLRRTSLSEREARRQVHGCPRTMRAWMVTRVRRPSAESSHGQAIRWRYGVGRRGKGNYSLLVAFLSQRRSGWCSCVLCWICDIHQTKMSTIMEFIQKLKGLWALHVCDEAQTSFYNVHSAFGSICVLYPWGRIA